MIWLICCATCRWWLACMWSWYVCVRIYIMFICGYCICILCIHIYVYIYILCIHMSYVYIRTHCVGGRWCARGCGTCVCVYIYIMYTHTHTMYIKYTWEASITHVNTCHIYLFTGASPGRAYGADESGGGWSRLGADRRISLGPVRGIKGICC